MNNQFYILLIAFAFCISCLKVSSDSEQDSDFVTWELKNNVKTLEEKSYQFIYNVDSIDLNEPDFERDFILQSVEKVSFNEDGMATENDSYRPEKLDYRTVQSFSDQGKVRKKIIYNEEGLVDYFHELTYDEVGNLEQDRAYHYDSTIYISKVFSYNELQQRVQEVHYRYKKKRWTRTFEYDRKGRLKMETYDSEQNPSTRLHSYNRSGELSSIVFQKPDGTLIKEEFYEYKGNVLAQKKMIDHRKNTRTIFQYNSEGFISVDRRWTMEDGIEKLKSKSAVYQYDRLGNWIRRDSYTEQRLRHIHLRKIEYY